MNYKLIHDTKKLQEFIDFLPELKPNEGYFLILVARAKWYPESGITSAVKLRRETINNKSKIIRFIKQLEVEEGTYVDNNGTPIHQNNIGVYIGYNPKDHLRGSFDLIKKCLDAVQTNIQGINIKSLANDVIQNANGSKNFLDIDVDIKEGEDYLEIIKYIKDRIDNNRLTFIKTSGGFHCLVKRDETVDDLRNDHVWYLEIKNKKHPFKSDLNPMTFDLIPLVGCNQGKFSPYIITDF